MRVVVVGAGVGGLAAAARLAAVGHDVVVCEQAATVGGKLARHEADGFAWDTGPSLLTMPQVLEELFAATGDPLDGVLRLHPVEPIARYRFHDGTVLDSTADLDAFCDRLDDALRPGSGDDWRRLMRRAGAMWRAVEQPFLRSPIGGARWFARQALRLGDLATVAPHRSLRSLGRTHLRDPRLRILLNRYATYTGSDPRRAPAALAVIPYAEQRFGAWYVEGGLYRIADALAERACERGAQIRTGADVRGISLSGGRVTGVTLADGERLRADVVVANADAAHVYRDLLAPSAGRRAAAALRRAVPSLSGFVVLLGLSGRTPDPVHHRVLFPRHYDGEFDAIFGRHPRPVTDPTVYVASPDDAAAAPAGAESWFVLVNAPRHGIVDWADEGLADDYAGHVLAVLASRGLDVRHRVVTRRVVSPADLALRTRAPGGAIYGTSSNGLRSAFRRPANVTAVPGLFLVGGSSHPGGGLPLVVLSAGIVADLVGSP
ncbi:MAG TPA: phytoene desaturase family protein [Egibacteraceae bacterium]|nr:phytoene desaturase family protein [Egibacteraceae bacterium]HVM14601.1 phytoene desaturase family protein [Egibacteraceae bacterium]HVM21408.1 phytoene desaturase family protein [Egibacteraceae bacterium]